MIRRLNIALLSALTLPLALPMTACAQESFERQSAEIVSTHPHDAQAFTQGLFIHDGELYESTGQVGQSTLRRVDLVTGDVLQSANIHPPLFGEGSVRVGEEIFMLSWQAGIGLIFNAESFEQVDTFSYPGEGWGLTYDGTRLIMSDGTANLRFLDPVSLELTDIIQVTLNGRALDDLNELEWVDGEIWANIWQSRYIMRIDPDSGHVLGSINLAGIIPDSVAGSRDAVANGIAWNSETDQIYVTGKLWPELYEIRVIDR